jgi:Tol biopolymer transport system component
MKFRNTLLAAAIAAGLTVATAGVASASFPGQPTVAFVRYDGADFRVMRMRPNGTEEHRVVGPETEVGFYGAAMSPDGERVVYVVYDGDQLDLWVKRLGGNPKQITDTAGRNEWSPMWSPDGKTIVFMETDDTSYSAIVTRRADGTRRREVYRSLQAYLYFPSFSPNGDRVLFSAPRINSPVRGGGGDYDLVTMRPDGTGRRWLTTDDDTDQLAGDWSPDGDRVAFIVQTPVAVAVSGTATPDLRPTPRGPTPVQPVYSMRSDGGGKRLITDKPGIYGRVLYTPDGKRVMFSRLANTTLDLFSTPVDGGVLKRLTETTETYNTFDFWGLPI